MITLGSRITIATVVFAMFIVAGMVHAKTDRDERLANTYLLKQRDSGKLKEYHNTSFYEATRIMAKAGLKANEAKACGPDLIDAQTENKRKPAKSADLPEKIDKVDQDLIQQRLEIAILMKAIEVRKQSKLTDSQKDWIQTIDLCDKKSRNAIRAIALMLQNYELLRAADI